MEKTWTISGVCGRWQLTVSVVPEEDTEFTADPRDVAAEVDGLKPHFYSIVNLLEAKAVSEPAEGLRR
ncbi:hypothetical protein ACTG9Q_01685 [Actinokineospora sp. 24-640]